MNSAPDSLATEWATQELDALSERGLRRQLEALESPQGPVISIAGRSLVNFSSNDYLSLAGDARLRAAAADAFTRFGVGSGASRLIVGDSIAHRALEAELASWLQTEAAVVFNSGYAANVGTVSTLCGPGDVVFSDELNHASLIDGCRLSRAQVVIYPHRDVVALQRLLLAHPGRRQLVVTDAVFSMDGDDAPLVELSALCRSHGAALMVDEAHATGVYGATGAGLCEQLGVTPDLRMGTLGKSLGCYGAYIASSGAVCELLVNRARSLVFSTSLPPALCEVARVAVTLVRAEAERRERLQQHIAHFARGLGLEQHRSAVFSVVLGTPERALAASQHFREHGVLVKAIRPPTVPQGTSRLRFALCAGHTAAQLEFALSLLEKRTRPAAPLQPETSP